MFFLIKKSSVNKYYLIKMWFTSVKNSNYHGSRKIPLLLCPVKGVHIIFPRTFLVIVKNVLVITFV